LAAVAHDISRLSLLGLPWDLVSTQEIGVFSDKVGLAIQLDMMPLSAPQTPLEVVRSAA